MMRLRRCALLLIEPREQLDFDLALLFQGETALRSSVTWFALAPHLEHEVALSAGEMAILGALGETAWEEFLSLVERFDAQALRRLLDQGLLVSDAAEHAAMRARDELLRDTYWRPVSAIAHYASRWRQASTNADGRLSKFKNVREMVAEYGAPPAHFLARVAASERLPLPSPQRTPVDDILDARVTCRNFAADTMLDAQTLSRILQRVFAARSLREMAPDALAVKKTSPSGGGLHPIEAYLLVRSVDGFAAGLYHYHCGDHALEPMRDLTGVDTRELAKTFVAEQDYFADAQVLVALTARFKRNFWKYRNHPKAYRAIILDAGHLSQTLYLSATELGLGAFVTAAINEIDIEQAFGLDALVESPIAVCGFGVRSTEKRTVEFDPPQIVVARE